MRKTETKLPWAKLCKREDVFFFKEGTFVKCYNDTMRYIVNTTNLHTGMVYYILLSHYKVNNNTCFPKLETLSAECGVSVNTVLSSLKRLEKEEIIKIDRGKKGKCNHYHFPLEEDRIKRAIKKENNSFYSNGNSHNFLDDEEDW